MKIKDLFMLSKVEAPKSDRPREKLVAKGVENLKDSKLLAILLRTDKAGEFEKIGLMKSENPAEAGSHI